MRAVPNAADSTGGQVSIEDFGNVLEWFGPFTPDETFPKRVQDIIKMKYISLCRVFPGTCVCLTSVDIDHLQRLLR